MTGNPAANQALIRKIVMFSVVEGILLTGIMSFAPHTVTNNGESTLVFRPIYLPTEGATLDLNLFIMILVGTALACSMGIVSLVFVHRARNHFTNTSSMKKL